MSFDRRPRGALPAAFLAILAAGLGCASPLEESVETSSAKALISPEQAKRIGMQVQSELQKQGVQLVGDSTVDGWVGKIADPLLAVEIGHVALYHVQRQMVDALGLAGVAALSSTGASLAQAPSPTDESHRLSQLWSTRRPSARRSRKACSQ